MAPRSTPRETALRPDLSPSALSVAHLPLQVAWNLPRATVFAATRGKGDVFGPDSVSLGVSRGTYSSPSSPLLPSFSLPARLSASRKIQSTCAFALRMSSSAQRSTAAQIFGSMRRGYCLRRATNVCSCEC